MYKYPFIYTANFPKFEFFPIFLSDLKPTLKMKLVKTAVFPPFLHGLHART